MDAYLTYLTSASLDKPIVHYDPRIDYTTYLAQHIVHRRLGLSRIDALLKYYRYSQTTYGTLPSLYPLAVAMDLPLELTRHEWHHLMKLVPMAVWYHYFKNDDTVLWSRAMDQYNDVWTLDCERSDIINMFVHEIWPVEDYQLAIHRTVISEATLGRISSLV